MSGECAKKGCAVECGCIVFSSVRELPDEFVDELRQFTDCFPLSPSGFNGMKYTLTLASEGFGIGMQKHNVAMFMLLIGEKNWYMTLGGDLEGVPRRTRDSIRRSHHVNAYRGGVTYYTCRTIGIMRFFT